MTLVPKTCEKNEENTLLKFEKSFYFVIMVYINPLTRGIGLVCPSKV